MKKTKNEQDIKINWMSVVATMKTSTKCIKERTTYLPQSAPGTSTLQGRLCLFTSTV